MNTDNIQIKSLNDTPFDDIADAFLAAFADYGMDLDKTKLHDMLTRRGARFDLSFAAFDGERIASFIINGIGRFNGRHTAYDTGTGTLKEYRGLGLTDRIFNYSINFLKDAGIETYLLEVLMHNTPAVKIYTRQGFKVSRGFNCYSAENSTILAHLQPIADNTRIQIRETSADTLCNAVGFMDFNPSWQNSVDSILRHPQAFRCLAAYDADTLVGIGVSETAYGDITLIAVDKTHRRQHIGSALLYRLIESNRIDRAKALNIADTCPDIESFLTASGFEPTCRQYEMVKLFCS